MSQLKATRALNACAKSSTSITEAIDFFGITSITSKDLAGAFSSKAKLSQGKLTSKFLPLTTKRSRLENEETTELLDYGKIRFDDYNKPKRHGQFEPSNARKLFETVDIKQSYVPIDAESSSINMDEIEEQPKPQEILDYREPYRIIDVKPDISIAEVFKMFREQKTLEEVVEYSNKPPLWFNFKNTIARVPVNQKHEAKTYSPDTTSLSIDTSKSEREDSSDGDERISMLESRDEYSRIRELDPEFENEFDDHLSVPKVEFDKSIEEKYAITDNQQPMKALDYLKKVRSGRLEPTAKGLKHRLETDRVYAFKPSMKLDSQGFRNYTHQVPNWHATRRVDVLNHLRQSILYHNYDILAINKPYGISSHSDDKKEDLYNLNDLVQELLGQKKLKAYLAHRLDKTTTGVLLFATSQERAQLLNKLFKSDQIKKTYWCITRGVPDLEQAIIDVPIGEFELAGKMRSCVVPEGIDDKRQLAKKHREARRAITEYKVINATKHAALVEVKPKTGVKHQIRCHMGFGLNSPILGDHKYSDISKMAPQKLPVQMLNALHLRQAKVRTLPIHLHAKSIVIPGAKANGETLFINAPMPAHFIENARALGLYSEEVKREGDK